MRKNLSALDRDFHLCNNPIFNGGSTYWHIQELYLRRYFGAYLATLTIYDREKREFCELQLKGYVTSYLILVTHLYQSNNIIVIKTIAVEFPGQSQVIAAKLQAHHKS